MAKKKIKELDGFVKDTNTKAIINTNSTVFEARRVQKKILQEKDIQIEQMQKDIDELKKLVKGLSKK
tara:strand:+ start:357 stop:557 length:201 start_codon:yes stop_codon:yes gene_type:complete